MWRLTAAAVLVALFMSCASASAAPYVSCPGGYIAKTLDQCPVIVKHPMGGSGRSVGGGGGGLLGDLLGHLGLGGLF